MSLRGFATLIYWADDVPAAADWYTELLGAGPYFTRPGPGGRTSYAKFRVGDQAELALADRAVAPAGTVSGPGGAVMHWRVDDLDATLARLTSMGTREYQPLTPHGPVVTASVIDPFGNLIGLLQPEGHPLADFRRGGAAGRPEPVPAGT
ncbi:VOC family protein [Geodermatophilus marinus]|uniref:VOC family protein n=1 Tax=Geodermatophilus sp. LHW52908 TaxID=2303986 RepID=UPI000E3BF0DA|nr:VOC family protein [Geodermatophilus sp. LHW52908]RFU22852.1 VOC family protein [Geodermatophilus sp. LHW52908]